MLSKMNAINYEPNHFVNDWGFYIDPENVIQNVPNNEEEIRKKYKVKRFYSSNNNYYQEDCNDICEEYNYYVKHNKYDDDIESHIQDDIKPTRKDDIKNIVVRVSSTTIITAFLSYIIFFVL